MIMCIIRIKNQLFAIYGYIMKSNYIKYTTFVCIQYNDILIMTLIKN